MSLVGFEPTISAVERPQTYALDRAATGTGTYSLVSNKSANDQQLCLQTALVVGKRRTAPVHAKRS